MAAAPEQAPNFGPVDPDFVDQLSKLHDYSGDLLVYRKASSLKQRTEYLTSFRVHVGQFPESEVLHILSLGESQFEREFVVVNQSGRIRGAKVRFEMRRHDCFPKDVTWNARDYNDYDGFKCVLADAVFTSNGWFRLTAENHPVDYGRGMADMAFMLGALGRAGTHLSVPEGSTGTQLVAAIGDCRESRISSWHCHGLSFALANSSKPAAVWWSAAARQAADVGALRPDESRQTSVFLGNHRKPEYLTQFANPGFVDDLLSLVAHYCPNITIGRETLQKAALQSAALSPVHVEAARLEVISFQWGGTPIALERLLGSSVPDQLWNQLVDTLALELSGRFGSEKARRLLGMPDKFSVVYRNSPTVQRNFIRLRLDLAERYDLSWDSLTADTLLRRVTDVDFGFETRRVLDFIQSLAFASDENRDDNYARCIETRHRLAYEVITDNAPLLSQTLTNDERAILCACWVRLSGDRDGLVRRMGIALPAFSPYGEILVKSEELLKGRTQGDFSAALNELRKGIGLLIAGPDAAKFADAAARRVLVNYFLLYDEAVQSKGPGFIKECNVEEPAELVRRLLLACSHKFEGDLDFVARISGYCRARPYAPDFVPLPVLSLDSFLHAAA